MAKKKSGKASNYNEGTRLKNKNIKQARNLKKETLGIEKKKKRLAKRIASFDYKQYESLFDLPLKRLRKLLHTFIVPKKRKRKK